MSFDFNAQLSLPVCCHNAVSTIFGDTSSSGTVSTINCPINVEPNNFFHFPDWYEDVLSFVADQQLDELIHVYDNSCSKGSHVNFISFMDILKSTNICQESLNQIDDVEFA